MFTLPFSAVIPLANTVASGAIDFGSLGTLLGAVLLATLVGSVAALVAQAYRGQPHTPTTATKVGTTLAWDATQREAA